MYDQPRLLLLVGMPLSIPDSFAVNSLSVAAMSFVGMSEIRQTN